MNMSHSMPDNLYVHFNQNLTKKYLSNCTNSLKEKEKNRLSRGRTTPQTLPCLHKCKFGTFASVRKTFYATGRNMIHSFLFFVCFCFAFVVGFYYFRQYAIKELTEYTNFSTLRNSAKYTIPIRIFLCKIGVLHWL